MPRDVKDVEVAARLRRAGDLLEVEYSITNRGDEPVWVLDDMLKFGDQEYLREPRLLLVRDAEGDGPVRLVRGVVHPRATVMAPLVAAARRLDPGATLTGIAETPLPLMSSHPQEPRRALKAPPERVVLEVGVMTGDVEVRSARLDDGGEAFVPGPATALWHQKLVRSAPLDLGA